MAAIPSESKFIDRSLGRPLTDDEHAALSRFNPFLHLTYTSRPHAPENGHAARMVVIDWASTTGRGRPAWKESLIEALSASSNYDAMVDDMRLRMTFDPSGSYWTFRMEHPDYRMTERRWRLDAFVAERGNFDEMGIRLSCLPGNEHRVAATTPRIVRGWLELGILDDGGRRLTPQPWFLADAEFDELVVLLHSPSRNLPVVVVSERVPRNGAGSFPVPPVQLARTIPGLAHVVAVSSAQSSRLTLEVGKSHSVFQGAVRSYMPGFSPESDRFAHPLYRPINTDVRSSGTQMPTQNLMGMIGARLRSDTVKAEVPPEWQEFDRVLGRRAAPGFLARLRGALGFSARG
jgi:hypothetical protein